MADLGERPLGREGLLRRKGRNHQCEAEEGAHGKEQGRSPQLLPAPTVRLDDSRLPFLELPFFPSGSPSALQIQRVAFPRIASRDPLDALPPAREE